MYSVKELAFESPLSRSDLMSLTVLHESASRRGSCALIPIKARNRCKTRLADVLAPSARLELVRAMLSSVLHAARNAHTVHSVLVISPERDTLPADIPVLADTGESLNSALMQAHRVVREFGCHEIVVLPADLPEITPADIDELVRAGRAGGCAIAPDAVGIGTNALYLTTPAPFQFQFGPDSGSLHQREARRLGLNPRVVRLPGLELDVDTAADLERMEGQPWLTRLQA
jgi:2-phospho-L-lactate/phosphoenolpyruvate guanylyltransferase